MSLTVWKDNLNSHAAGLLPKILKTDYRRRSICILFHLIVNMEIMRNVIIYCPAIVFKVLVFTPGCTLQILKSSSQIQNQFLTRLCVKLTICPFF